MTARTPLRCHKGCGTDLVEPEFSIKPYLKDMEQGDCCVVHRMNSAYSDAVWAANRAHLDACRGLPVGSALGGDAP